MVQVLDVGCPLHFLATKDLQILQEMKIQERWGLLLSSHTIAIFWCIKLLAIAELPFLWAKPEKISYVLTLAQHGNITMPSSNTQGNTTLMLWELAAAVKYSCRGHTCNRPIWRNCFPLSWCGTAPNLVLWNRDVGSLCSEVVEARHALPPAEFDGRRTAGTSGWLGYTTMVAGAHGNTQIQCLRDEKWLSWLDWNICNLQLRLLLTCCWLPACHHFLLSRSTSWGFYFLPGEKNLRTIWKQHQCERLSLPWAPSDSSA